MIQKKIEEKINSLLPENFWETVENYHPHYNSQDIAKANDLHQYMNDEADEEMECNIEKDYNKEDIPLESALANLKVYLQTIQHIASEEGLWSYYDVLELAKEMEIELRKDEAEQIMSAIYKNHDANTGINWDVIETAIKTYKNIL